MTCSICAGTNHVSTMTDGRTSHDVCDDCRELMVTLFHVYRSMAVAVGEATTAKRGTKQ